MKNEFLLKFKFFQSSVGIWADKQFPHSNSHSLLTHLNRELKELSECTSREDICEEIADCSLLLMHLAHKNNCNLIEEAIKKHSINLSRTWGPPDKDGCCHHIT